MGSGCALPAPPRRGGGGRRTRALTPAVARAQVVVPEGAAPAISTVLDLACGHGLVGILLAHRFPSIRVVAIDLERRDASRAFVGALRECGAALDNIRFVEGDFNAVAAPAAPRAAPDGGPAPDAPSAPSPALGTAAPAGPPGPGPIRVSATCLVLCVHGCGPANQQAIELARRGGAPWLVVPCCLCADLYLAAEHLRLPDDTRYTFLCGAMAGAYGADRVTTLDPRITPRAIVLSGGGGGAEGATGSRTAGG